MPKNYKRIEMITPEGNTISSTPARQLANVEAHISRLGGGGYGGSTLAGLKALREVWQLAEPSKNGRKQHD
jgi:hypothetical protein